MQTESPGTENPQEAPRTGIRHTYVKWGLFALAVLLILPLSILGMLRFSAQEQVPAAPADTPNTATNPWPEVEVIEVSPDLSDGNTGWAYPNAEELGIEIRPHEINTFTEIQPWFPRAQGTLPQLINNPLAKDPGFDELKAFIIQDTTNEEEYLDHARHCMDFAEMLHNRAEEKGIKAAFVGMDFASDSWIVMPGHALNAFNTTDKGLVFVDCSGFRKDEVSLCQSDRIAYFAIGREYGTIGISQVRGLDYSYYLEYEQPRKEYVALLSEYESGMQAFNQSYSGKNLTPAQNQAAQAAEAELNSMRQKLESMYREMGECVNLPMGIVETVYIFW